MGVRSFEALAEADPRRIEIVTGRKYPFGNHIKESLSTLPPKVEIKVEEVECQKQGVSKLTVTLTRLSQPLQSTKRHYADMVGCLNFPQLYSNYTKDTVPASPLLCIVL